MGRYKKIIKAKAKKEISKEEIIKKSVQETTDETNLIITKDLDKVARLKERGYKLKEVKVDLVTSTPIYVFYKN